MMTKESLIQEFIDRFRQWTRCTCSAQYAEHFLKRTGWNVSAALDLYREGNALVY